MIVDVKEMKDFIEEIGIKQNVISAKTGISEAKLSFILQNKRKLEAGEYAAICKALDVPMTKFVKDKVS